MKKINYIFLDIDGVLNTRDHLLRQKKETGECSRFNWCPIACNNIIRLCKKYNSKIVISSSWRHEYCLEMLKEFFESNGISKEYIIDTTPSVAEQSDRQNYCRGHEIKQWLDNNANPNSSYLIIDDAADVLKLQQNNFVKVSLDDGFASSRSILEAVQILNNHIKNV